LAFGTNFVGIGNGEKCVFLTNICGYLAFPTSTNYLKVDDGKELKVKVVKETKK